ncbi:LamG-like jellyroll fold domain-containing protein [Streptosporangium sp. NBC_01469]|uniref:LamG-like jellyroll fold domain-containing protein n=1 Tax=Streptosporangium sp. NBC_01469 TaxID=2903898 RepID=UPI002E2D8A28|nr:LamG-like jellyroll fold domain-containing protein [Streptosporangium sp. NBC_01469]
MVAALPGLLLFQAVPVSAAVRPAALLHGTPDTPDQLTGSAAGFPSLVDSAATTTTVSLPKGPEQDIRSGKDALPVEKRFTDEGPRASAAKGGGLASQDGRRAERRGAAEATGSAASSAAADFCDTYTAWSSSQSYTSGAVVAYGTDVWKVRGFSAPVGTPPPSAPNSWVHQGTCSFHQYPSVDVVYPYDGTLVEARTPTLRATGRGNDSSSPVLIRFTFKVCDNAAMTGTCPASGAVTNYYSGGWKVPPGKLTWSKQYWWNVTATDTSNNLSTTSSTWSFTTGVRQPVIGSQLAARGVNGQEFHQMPGNYTTEATDLSVSTPGPSLSVTRSYNSMDARVDGIFGAGWSTRWDMKLVREVRGDLTSALVTYPDGRRVRFAANGDGSFQPPPGMHATLADVTGGGWKLMDKSSTVYLFDAQGRLTTVTDAHGRAQNLLYAAGGKLEKVTAAGDRSLSFTWSGTHVASVSSDPVNGSPVTWTYHYEGDKLTAVCAPVAAPNCTRYTYDSGSQYRGIVQDTEPYGYWRLGEASGWQAADLGSGAGSAEYSAVTYGKPGALAGTPDTAVEFNNSRVTLPQHALAYLGDQVSAEMWFKTTTSGVLMASSVNYGAVPEGPMLYVGTDGKLRGAFKMVTSPMGSAAVVNDDQWHHVALTISGADQVLYLDGAQIGTMTAQADPWRPYAAIGTGIVTRGSAPGLPTGTGSQEFPFRGLIDEVAIYGKPLTAAEVALHYAARAEAPHKLTKITLPSERVWAANTYDAGTERISTHTDQHGGTWKIGKPVYAQATGLSTVTVTDPNNNTLGYAYDAWRGYRLVNRTDQLGKITRYEYDTGGFPAKVTDPNGVVTEQVNDARGNVTATKTCQAAGNCQTTRQAFYRNSTDEFDPRNDRPVTHRDARSTSATDNTYATTTEYTIKGEVAKKTTPATPDFPSGRSTTYAYTDGTEPAIGGGTTPAGLRKSAKDARGSETTYRYTAAGDQAEQTSPSGLKIQFAHDALGRVISRTEVSQAHPDGVVTTSTYDGLGRVLTHTGAGVKNEVTNVTHTAKTTFAYDADGNKLSETVTDLTGGDPERKITYAYGSSGRVETVTGPEGGVARVTWNAVGAKASLTDEKGTVSTYAYTKRGELASTTLKGWTGSPVNPQAPQDVVLESFSYDPGGRLAGEVDAMGRKTAYTYFTDNRLSQLIGDDVRLNGSATAADVVLEANTYDAAGNITKQVTGGGKTTEEYVYDAAGRVTSTTFDPATLKRKSAYEYDAAGNLTKEAFTGAGSPRIESTSYAYNAVNLMTRQTVENGADDLVSTWSYDDRGLVTEVTDPRGNAAGAIAADFTTTMRYDLAGQLVESKSPQVKIDKNGSAADGRPTVRYGYDSAGVLTHSVDAEGRTVTSAFDKAGRLASTTLPSYTPPGGTALIPKISYEYDVAGQLTSVTDPRGHVTSVEYDALGRQVRVTDPGPSGPGGKWVSEYDLLGEQLAMVDPTGARVEATYDDLGRMITQTQIERRPTTAAHITTLTYDSAGNLTKSVTPGNKSTSYTVNAAGQVTAITDPNTNTSAIGYDFLGRSAKVTDPEGNATEAEYDLAGRQIAAKDLDATGATVRTFGFGRDPVGNLISSTSGEGHLTRRTFDALGQMTALIEPVSDSKSITSTFGYDASGARTRTTEGRGNAVWTDYNTLGLPESVIEPPTPAHPSAADRTWTTVYDAAGNATATLQPGGVRIDRTFDALGQMVKETGSGASVATPERNVTYDTAGRVTAIGDHTLEYNDRSLLTKVSKATNQVAAYGYDARGNLSQRIDTTGTANYTWDDADRLKTASDPVTGRTFTYGYDKANRLTTQTSANPAGTQTYTYDAVDRPTSQTLKNSSNTQLAKIVYGWDKDDNLTTKTTTGTAGAGTNTYGYDHAGRLTSWTAPGGATTAYEWDDSGNRTKAGNETFVYDERNRLTSGGGTDYTYTPRGTVATETKAGVTRNLTFDAFDRLISDGEASYGYDALDRMTSRTKGADQQRFTYSGLENDIATVSDGANTIMAKYGRDPFGGLLSLQEGGTAALGVMSDLHGDVVGTFSGTALVDSVAYDPFGKVTHRSGTARTLGYQGEYTDPDTGKVNMHARWYQPGTGTFSSRDDWTLNPNPSIQGNRYTYANGTPLATTDPTGHWPWNPECWGRGNPFFSVVCDVFTDARPNAAKQSDSQCMPNDSRPVCPQKRPPRPPLQPVNSQGKNNIQGKTGSAPTNNPCQNCGGSGPTKPKPTKPKPKKPDPPYKPDFDPNSEDFINDPNNATEDRDPPTADELHCNYGRDRPENFGGCTNGIDIIGGGGGGGSSGVSLCEAGTTHVSGDRFKYSCPSSVKPVDSTPDSPAGPTHPEQPPTIIGGLAESCSGNFVCDIFVGDFMNCAANPSLGDCAMTVIGFIPGAKIATTLAKTGSKFAKGAAKACKPNSFVAGTLVLMADGTQKPIEDVEIGEYVLATDPETGRTEAMAVTVLIPGEGTKNLVRITVDTDGDRGNVTAPITATDEHPFWVPSLREWTDAGELQPGMWLQTSAGTHVQVSAIKKWTTTRRVHNLTVDNIHTYHVVAGDQAILVHNTNSSSPCRFEVDSRGVTKDLDADMNRAGKKFSPAEKRKTIDKCRSNNGGRTVCDDCGIETIPAKQCRTGGTVDPRETRVDHMWPQSLGGPGSVWNGRVTCFVCNGNWSNTPKGPL